MNKISEQTIKEAINLRTKGHLSLSQISKVLNISKSSCSGILRDYPLPKDVRIKLNTRNKKSVDLDENIFSLADNKLLELNDSENFTSNQKGNISELAVRLRLEILGIEVYTSDLDGSIYDGVISVNDSFKKIQIRWASKEKKSRNSSISLRKSDGRNKSKSYSENDLDFIFAYDFSTDSVYVYAWEDIKHNINSFSMKKEALENFEILKG